jgi:hypothetical protein
MESGGKQLRSSRPFSRISPPPNFNMHQLRRVAPGTERLLPSLDFPTGRKLPASAAISVGRVSTVLTPQVGLCSAFFPVLYRDSLVNPPEELQCAQNPEHRLVGNPVRRIWGNHPRDALRPPSAFGYASVRTMLQKITKESEWDKESSRKKSATPHSDLLILYEIPPSTA